MSIDVIYTTSFVVEYSRTTGTSLLQSLRYVVSRVSLFLTVYINLTMCIPNEKKAINFSSHDDSLSASYSSTMLLIAQKMRRPLSGKVDEKSTQTWVGWGGNANGDKMETVTISYKAIASLEFFQLVNIQACPKLTELTS